MLIKFIPTTLDGCLQIHPFFTEDKRGTFVKTFHTKIFSELGFPIIWSEEYYSYSYKDVIRGMHFQTPPYDHEKLVYCMHGRVLDVVIDLRKSSSTFGRHFAIELDSTHGSGLLIPKGMAHGFLTLSESAIVSYKVTSTYAPLNDSGIRWDSFGLDWGLTEPILSVRDQSHPPLANFDSPF